MTTNDKIWSYKSKTLIKELHQELCISHKNWHIQKSNSTKRAAELLITALSQLSNNGDLHEVEKLLSQSIKWLNKEIQDPGCPDKNKKDQRLKAS
tara:strand:+ start:406 stop:690 length:285 start_codon:yes stop_codon:yes gene_type:complete